GKLCALVFHIGASQNETSLRASATFSVTDFPASSNVKCRAREEFRSLDLPLISFSLAAASGRQRPGSRRISEFRFDPGFVFFRPRGGVGLPTLRGGSRRWESREW